MTLFHHIKSDSKHQSDADTNHEYDYLYISFTGCSSRRISFKVIKEIVGIKYKIFIQFIEFKLRKQTMKLRYYIPETVKSLVVDSFFLHKGSLSFLFIFNLFHL